MASHSSIFKNWPNLHEFRLMLRISLNMKVSHFPLQHQDLALQVPNSLFSIEEPLELFGLNHSSIQGILQYYCQGKNLAHRKIHLTLLSGLECFLNNPSLIVPRRKFIASRWAEGHLGNWILQQCETKTSFYNF